MSKRRILTIGFELATSDCQFESFRSKASLLDWDVILIAPTILNSFHYNERYQGKPCLTDDSSFQLKEACEHWRREIKQALDAGKTVIVFLTEPEEVFVDSGRREYSGTGRNQRTTRIVEAYNNYRSLPVSLHPVAATGSAMKLTAKGAEILVGYWSEFEAMSQYQCHLVGDGVPASIVTRSGDRVVGSIFTNKNSTGTLCLLPTIDFYADGFVKEVERERHWTKKAQQFAHRFVSAIVDLDKATRIAEEATPVPRWAKEEQYALGTESALRLKLLNAEKKVTKAQAVKESIEEELKSAGRYRALLFEKGKPLETAIISALRLIGFSASNFESAESEFDVVFESAEGRFIGEAEGKDAKAVNVDKLRQLSMNVHEDLQREEVAVPAKAVLFGNAARLTDPAERGEPFTEKCVSAAALTSTALVSTADLFAAIQYYTKSSDENFARQCRLALLSTTGRVQFPIPPCSEPNETMETSVAAESE